MRTTTKRTTLLVAVLMLVAITSIACLAGCGNTGKRGNDMYAGYENIASGARYYSIENNAEKNKDKFSLSAKKNQRKDIYMDLGEPKTFNTIVLNEKSDAVTLFNIYASNKPDAKSFNLIYEGDTIEDFRVCFVGNVAYQYLHIEVATASEDYNVNDIKIYNNINADTSKKVTSYVLLDRVRTTDLRALDTVSDIILFSWARFNQNGEVAFYMDDPNREQKFLPQEVAKAKYIEELNYLKGKVNEIETAQNRKINIYVDILMPLSDDAGDANKYARAMMQPDRATKTAQNIATFVDELGFDGVDLDYEYPYSREEWDLYNKFLVTLKATLTEGKKLSTALGAWNINLSKDAIAAIDYVQLMTYDIFDSHGYHGSFNVSMLRDLDVAINKGVPAEKINLGIPFYSRPLSRAGYWGDYFRFFEVGALNAKLPTTKYKNIVTYPARDSADNLINEPEYFNGYQMVQDKTAFAIDTNVAGIMIWHMNCDIEYTKELSLFRAINETFRAKNAKLAINK